MEIETIYNIWIIIGGAILSSMFLVDGIQLGAKIKIVLVVSFLYLIIEYLYNNESIISNLYSMILGYVSILILCSLYMGYLYFNNKATKKKN